MTDLTTTQEARDALAKELKGVESDNPVGAAKVLGRVASRVQFSHETEWASFALSAEKALNPWLNGRARVVAEGIVAGCREQGARQRNGAVDNLIAERSTELPCAVSALEAEPPDTPSFAITGVLLKQEIHLLVSDGGDGKTSVALAMAGSLANGSPLFDFPGFEVSEPGPVLFISEEDGVGVLQNRLGALVRGHGWDHQRVMSSVFLLAQEGTTLDTLPWREHILAEVKRIGARLLILDPLAELTLAAENSNDDAKPLVRFLREITTTTGAAVLLLHHAGKMVEGKRKLDRVRGASALNSAARAIYFLESMEIGIAVECLKLSRSEKPPKFVIKREIQSDPENPALWTSARLSYASQTDAEDQAAERLVLDQLARRGSLNSSQLKELAKGTGIGAVDVSRAIKNLDALGTISHEKGPKNSKIWSRRLVARESGQPEESWLPGCPEVAGQPGKGSSGSSPLGGGTGASATGQPEHAGQPETEASHPVEGALSTEEDT